MKRAGKPALSADGQAAVTTYAHAVETEQDVSPATYRNYVSDLHQFAAWCETVWNAEQEAAHTFLPTALTTPRITRYRTFLQHTQQLKPASINRALVSIKRYTAWACGAGLLIRDPARSVKLIPTGPSAPRQLSDNEEDALLAAVATTGSVRDQTIITLMLHTGLRAREVCTLQRDHITIGKRSGVLSVYGKRNKYRDVPLNSTARTVLAAYLPIHPGAVSVLFTSGKTGQALTERALGYVIAKYARQAQLSNVSSHDLRHRFGYRMAKLVPLHRLAQIMGHDSLDTTLLYVRGTSQDLQQAVETIAWQ